MNTRADIANESNRDLVKRLRAEDPETGLRWSIASEAADRIEQLEAALQKIAAMKADPEFGTPPLASAIEVARAALEGKDG